MDEIIIGCNIESPQKENEQAIVEVLNEPEEDLLYKFIVGFDGAWEILKDFGVDKRVGWRPKKHGNYMIMVQAKRKDSTKAFNYISKKQFFIGEANEKLIKEIFLDKEEITIGDKINVEVKTEKEALMFRYFIKENEKWLLAKDYSVDKIFTYSSNLSGKHEILVQCKSLDSEKNFEEAMKVEFNVHDIKKIEITNLKCLNSSILIDEELIFEVESKCDSNRTTLYKFVKLSDDGKVKCIQDYSTKKKISYIEKSKGKYKLLCLAKDMYSPKEYDDRALLYYEVKAYNPVIIQSFSSDMSSPQIVGQEVKMESIVTGGKDLRYRFIIEGEKNEDTGYMKNNVLSWKSQKPGEYKISLWVRDVSCRKKYEACSELNFVIDEIPREPIKINDVVLDKRSSILIGDTININVLAGGGSTPLYSFIVKKGNKEIERIEYRKSNFIDFKPKEQGKFHVEVRVKDQYSDKEFDAHSIVFIEAYEYIPASIDYVLMQAKEHHLVGEQIIVNVIMQDTKDMLLKYKLQIDGHNVENTDYINTKRYILTPKCSGKYTIRIYAKNKNSKKEFDSMKEINLKVTDALPVRNTILKSDRIEFFCHESINVNAESFGGKDVIYEFYLMEKGEWNLVQKYSKKTYYTFMPFCEGTYKILVLAKSRNKKLAYEDYSIMKFKVNEKAKQVPLENGLKGKVLNYAM